MARLPILQRQVSANVLRDPGVSIPNQPDYAASFAQVADEIGADLAATRRAQQNLASRTARMGLTRDASQFINDHKNDDDPDTLQDRFNKHFAGSLQTHAGTLSGQHLEEFTTLSKQAKLDFDNQIQSTVLGIENDRLVASTNETLAQIQDDFVVSDDPTRLQLRGQGIEALDNLLDRGIINHTQHQAQVSAFQETILSGLADRLLVENPEALLDIDTSPIFEEMSEAAQIDFKVKADRVIERRQKQEQREYLASFDQYTKALAAGVTVSPSLQLQFSDDRIDATVSDPEARETLKAQRDTADLMASDVRTLPDTSPAVMNILRERLIAETQQEANNGADITKAMLARERLANFEKVRTAVLQARNEDSARTVIDRVPFVKEQFNAFLVDPNPETFEAYRDQLELVQHEQGHRSPRLLPKGFVEAELSELQSSFATEPEQAAGRLALYAEAAGEDWARVLSEFQSAGLSGDLSAVGYVLDQPGNRTRMVQVARNGGLTQLKKQVEKSKRDTMDSRITSNMSDAIKVAGSANGQWMFRMQQAAQSLAYSLHLDGLSETAAADKATEAVLDRNFTVINATDVKGMVPKSAGIDTELLEIGADRWLERRLDAVLTKAEDLPQLSLVQFARHFPEGIAQEDMQSVAREIVSNAGRFELSPDGEHAFLVAPAAGMLSAVFDAEGRPITVPVAELMAVGASFKEEFGSPTDTFTGVKEEAQKLNRVLGRDGGPIDRELDVPEILRRGETVPR